MTLIEKTKAAKDRYDNGEYLKDVLFDLKLTYGEYRAVCEEELLGATLVEKNIVLVQKAENKLFEIAAKLNNQFLDSYAKARLETQFNTLNQAFGKADVQRTIVGIPNELLR